MSNRWGHSLCCSETCERAEKHSKRGEGENFEILQFIEGKDTHTLKQNQPTNKNNNKKKQPQVAFLSFFPSFSLRLLRVWSPFVASHAFPKSSAMKCWTAELLGTSQMREWEKKFPNTEVGVTAAADSIVFPGNRQVHSWAVAGQAEQSGVGREKSVIGSSIIACQTPALPGTQKGLATSALVQWRQCLPSLYQMTGCFFANLSVGFPNLLNETQSVPFWGCLSCLLSYGTNSK